VNDQVRPGGAAGLDPDGERVAAICRELQNEAGDRPFFLSGYDAGRLLEVSQPVACNYINALCTAGLMQLITPGSLSEKKANEYRYRGAPKRGNRRPKGHQHEPGWDG
jgi:hypothetical protein